MMSGIKSKNTRPEILIRKQLHRMGYRYKLHDKSFPGKPDLVFPKYRAVVFVHGCFWHQHHCHLFKWPKTRPEFWRKKIQGNVIYDEKVKEQLLGMGWRVCVVWECAVKGKSEDKIKEVAEAISYFLREDRLIIDI
ncbi:DNA mismatch endonuclease Vsr [Paraneptunicella aestuarii]|nr:DNA mismatch endonuclease Vsr [Paraneptunicella aestuarii]